MRPESLLFVLPSLTALGGGIELYLRQLLEAIAEVRPDARLTVVLAREALLARPELLSDRLRSRLDVVGTARSNRTLRIAEVIARAALAARDVRPTTVVCGHVNYATLSLLLARACSARSIVLTYGVEAWNVERTLTVHAMRAADRVIAISAFTASQITRALDLRPEQVAIVHNSIDVARFTPGRASAAIEETLARLPRPRLLTVCRLDASEAYKGVDTVARVLAEHRGLAGSYLVIGDGTDRPRLERLAQELDVPVTFYGRASDEELVDLYRACDLFVMPSRKEGFGYVFIEAMACGVPTVAGSVDGSVDALGGGALGLLVDPLDHDAIAGAITAQLGGTTAASMRDPAWLHAEVARRFGAAAFRHKVERALR